MQALLLWCAICCAVGALIGKSKGKQALGGFLGFLLGPIGWLIIALQSSNKPKCKDCKGEVEPGARKCKNCGSSLISEGTIVG